MGIWISNINAVKPINTFFTMFWLATNGVVCNLTTANWFVKGLAAISPLRFACEGITRTLITQVPDLSAASGGEYKINQKDILDTLGYTYGNQYCAIGLLAWIGVWMLLSLIVINKKYR